jgi:hypothetical protein
MKRTALLLVAVAIFLLNSLPALAAEPADGKKNRLCSEVEFDYYSKYVCSTSGALAYNKSVAQGSVRLSLEPLGLYVKFWGSGILDPDHGKLGGNEIDWSIGMCRPVWKFMVDVGYAFYDLYPQFRAKGDLHAIYGTIRLPNKHVEPYLTVECDIPTHKQTLPGGWTYRLGVSKSLEIRKSLTLIADVSIGGNDGAYGYSRDFFAYVRGGLGLAWEPWKNVQVIPQIYYQKRLGRHPSRGGITGDVCWGGVSFVVKHNLLSF